MTNTAKSTVDQIKDVSECNPVTSHDAKLLQQTERRMFLPAMVKEKSFGSCKDGCDWAKDSSGRHG